MKGNQTVSGVKNRIHPRVPFAVMAVVSVVVLLAAAGCSLFEPRDAQEPGGSDRVAFKPANDASGIFANLRSGIENLAQGFLVLHGQPRRFFVKLFGCFQIFNSNTNVINFFYAHKTPCLEIEIKCSLIQWART